MSATEAQKRQAGVGSATGRVNYPLYEKVMMTHQTEGVKNARAEHWEPDVLGVKGPQWDSSVPTRLPETQKHQLKTSDMKLSNTLRPDLLSASDNRMLNGTTHCKADKGGVFDRGEVTVGGWDKSTARDEPAVLRAREAEALQKSLANTARATTKLSATGSYVTPTQRVTALTDSMRRAKEEQAAEYAALVERYGEEGAELMQEIQKMPQVQNPKGGRATKEDVNAVLSLPDFGEVDD